MRFRGVIRDHGCYRCLSNVVAALSKNSREVALDIAQDDLLFVIREEAKKALPLIWCQMKPDAVFEKFNFTGVSPERNHIVLVFNPTFLAKALGSIKVFEYVTIKLTKLNQNAYMRVDARVCSTISSEFKNIQHDIPVKVILPPKWDLFCLPRLPMFYTVVELPNVKNIIDKYKNLSPYMTFYVNVTTSSLYLTIETDLTTVISHFFNLNIEHRKSSPQLLGDSVDENDDSYQKDGDIELACQVGTKTLALFFNSVQFPILQKALFINNQNAIKFRFTINDGVTLYGIASAMAE